MYHDSCELKVLNLDKDYTISTSLNMEVDPWIDMIVAKIGEC